MVPPLLKPNQLTPRRQTGVPCASTSAESRTRSPRGPAASDIAAARWSAIALGPIPLSRPRGQRSEALTRRSSLLRRVRPCADSN